MSKRRLIPLSLIVVGFLVVGLFGLTAYYNTLPERLSQHETIVVGQERFTPGSQATLRVVVRDSKDGSPLPEAKINISMRPQDGGPAMPLYNGVTDPQGGANVVFRVPENVDAQQTLVVETRSSLGSDTLERQVTVQRDYRLLLTSDKPIYQPGQVIHLRALALSAFDLIPAAGQEVEIVIADGKGNKVFRKKVTTTEFGAAWTDFLLADEVNTGPYKISASMGNTSSEKTVQVEHYVLPKFKLALQSERDFYLPGERVRGSLSANYFFGKPVAGGEVAIQGYTFDVQQNLAVELQGVTDEQGNFEFEFDLPAYIAGSDLEGGLGRFYVQALVTDLARHSETANLLLPVSNSLLVVEAIPEGGQFRPGVENILYVLTSYPDGAPAEASLRLTFYYGAEQEIMAETGPYGLAEIRLTPQDAWQQFVIEARDLQGNIAQREFYFEGESWGESVLLRPELPVYRVGEAMKLTILTSQPKGTVYLDIVREGQTVSTRSVEMSDGLAEVVVDLTPDLYGTLELHAYKILTSGAIVRDTRLVVVDNANDLDVSLTPGQETYLPGENASLDVRVGGEQGGVRAALGIAIVDESVFALAEQDPGFAKLYFLLEQQLLQPKYDLHGFSLPDLVRGAPVNSDLTLQAIEETAQASLAAAAAQEFGPNISAFGLEANSHEDAIRRVEQIQERYFSRLSAGLFIALLAVPLVVLGLSVYALWRQKRLWRSLGIALVIAVLLLPAQFFLLLWISEQGGVELSLLCLGLAGLAGYLGLVVVAWRRKDASLGWSLGLLPLLVGLLVFLFYALENGDVNPDETLGLVGLLFLLLLPLAFLLRAAGFAWERRAFPAAAALLLSALFLVTPMAGIYTFLSPRAMMAAPLGGDMMMQVEEPAMEMAPMLAAPANGIGRALGGDEAEKKAGAATGEVAESGAEPPRLRQYFPETMLWLPDPVTDENGNLKLDFPVADSITTWRVTALASSQDGRLGSNTLGLRVFQDFFIDLDLPLALTVGDEVAVPVGVFNYLEQPQTVRLELAQMDWFELLDEPVKQIEIAANDISVVYFRVRAVKFGRQPFKVTALGSQMSDAIQKEVRVFPDGKQINFTQSDRLSAGMPVRQVVNIPADAIPGTQSLVVKVYPGILSQVVEGLDSILRMPYGCFEQTTSATYPNVLVLDYLKTTGQASPESQMKAEEYINLGYQRLLTFEVSGSGGFSLFGDSPADRMLTAYGLQEFADMGRVHDVDPDLVRRAADWLLSQQNGDGSWENDRGLVHEDIWSSLGDDRLPVTAYIAWSLVDAGFGDHAGTQKGVAYVREGQAKAEDPYVIALVANALVAADLKAGDEVTPATQAVLDRLAGMASMDGNAAFWSSGVSTFMGSQGQTGSIETSALAALAFLRSNTHPELGNAALTYLVQQKDSYGTWYSTQATVMALKALLQSVRAGVENVDAAVTVSLNGSQAHSLQVSKENFDVVQLISFDDINLGRENTVEISVQGEGNLMYQVTGGYYLPWEKLALYPDLAETGELVTIDVQYDRTELAVDDTVEVKVTVTLNEPGGRAESALIDLGLPPGFTVLSEDLAALVARFDDVPEDYAFPTIERYELTGRQILVYISNLSYGAPLEFSYRLRAKFPLSAQTPASNAYDYYNPEVSGEAAPQMLVVKP
ncbi:MAG: hypothetical protein JXA78_12320 [Anaerolineales bacterium]|nr:hypothetical protein [Anaerolineales bacterium]